ncbi:STAS domain-containing protein [Allokutzneria sp. NRRL B-24872]|uniref:STAS domain-containing protein n=1 Tax=Allokutzneria sp. NRRL B-24872 TaxID=1137961 RepID=UPI00143CEE57|nr:STAS domain-containing protein [Allokutzneria sp. NRRL B-24872]
MSVELLTVSARSENDHWLVALSGAVDLASRQLFLSALDEAAARDERAVVLDLTSVTFLGSTGLFGLVRLQRALREQRRDLRLVAVHEAVLMPLRVTGLDAEFAIRAP